MKAKDLKNKSVQDLNKDILEAKIEIFNLRFQGASGELKNTSRVKAVRRNIARMKTVQTILLSEAKSN